MNEDFLNSLRLLEEQERQSTIDRILRGLQLSGGGGTFDNSMASGYGYGGRVGYAMPVGQDQLTAGLTGMGYKAETPAGTVSDRGLTGADVSYKFGPNTLSFMYDKQGMMPSQIAPQNPYEMMPLQDFYRLMYRREF
jgi:hypothetical protein